MDGLHQLAEAKATSLAPSTQESHAVVWRRLLAFFPGGQLVTAVDDLALLRYLAHARKQKRSDNSTRLDFAWLKKALTAAQRKRLLPWVPEFPEVKQVRREQTLAPGELEKILSHMPPWYRLFFQAAEEVGWRARSELTTRKWTHVDLGPEKWACSCGPTLAESCDTCGLGRPGWLLLEATSTKAGKARQFPMTRRLRELLGAARRHVLEVQQRTGRIVPWVFCRDDGSRFKDYSGAWHAALRKAGIGKLEGRKGPWSSARVVHDIRRTTLRRWERGNRLDLTTRLDLAGHTEKAHAMYLEQGPDQEALRAAAVKLDQQRMGEEPESKVVQLDLFRAKG
jgi:hypothetical protein